MECFICNTATADSELKVSITRMAAGGAIGQQRQYQSVPVPICAACKNAETAARTRQAKIALIAFVIPVVIGLIAGAANEATLQGGFVGFGFGFVLSLITAAVSKPYTKAIEHPEVQTMKAQGWSIGSQN